MAENKIGLILQGKNNSLGGKMSAKVPESCTDNVKTIAVFTGDTHTHTL